MSMASDKSETAKNRAAAARGAWMLQVISEDLFADKGSVVR